MDPVNISIWSDLACPWCWIGKRALDTALDQFDGEAVLDWKAFELNPAAGASSERVDYAEKLAEKYRIDRTQSEAFIHRMVDAGKERGIEMRFDRIRPSNTFDAHRLVALAATDGRASAMKERLFKAYLNEGKSLADHATLQSLAEECGLDANQVRALLAGDQFAADVRADEAMAQQLGISGVPTFVFDDSGMAISGAHPPDALLKVLRRAQAAKRSSTA